MAKLVGVKGPAKDQEFPVGDTGILGRSFDADLRVNDLTASRHHAKLTKTAMGYVIVDLGSSNGTSVNGERVYSPKLLREGDTIEIAQNVFRFVEAAAHPSQQVETLTGIILEAGHEKDSTITASVDLIAPMAPERLRGDPGALYKATMRLKTVLALSNTIQRELDVQKVLDEIMNGIFRIFPQADRGFIMLREPGTTSLVPSVLRTRTGQPPAQVTISRSIRDEVVSKRMGVLVADATTDTRFMQAESIVSLHIRSAMCVPLVAENDLVGIVHIDTFDPNAAFTRDDLETLTGIANQAALAIGNATLHKQLMDQQRLERDLLLAQQVQLSFLPDRTPEICGMKFCASYQPAMKVGGDLYDFIEQPNNRLAVVVGDVAGKGLPAALFMARMTGDVRFLALSDREPKDILRALNSRLLKSCAEDSFVTLLLARLDANEGRVTLASAGHLPAILRGKQVGQVRCLEEQTGFPLGVAPDGEYMQEEVLLKEGDTLALFTDGITDAMDAERRSYGEERLLKAIAEGSSEPSALLSRVLEDVHKHVGETQQSDDLTFVCFGKVS